MDLIIDGLSKQLLEPRNRHFFIVDTIIFLITPILGLAFRLDSFITLKQYGNSLIVMAILFLVIKLAVSYMFGLYRHCWRYASIDELVRLAMLTSAVVVLETLVFYGTYQRTGLAVHDLPQSLLLLDVMLSFLFIGSFRFSTLPVKVIQEILGVNQLSWKPKLSRAESIL